MYMGNKGVKCDQNVTIIYALYRYLSTRHMYMYVQKSPSTDYIHVHYLRYTSSVCIRKLKRSLKK